MIAAIYARKSTEQNGIGDEAKSVHRQIDHARAYAQRKGWTVAEAYVYSDDGISGAEFEHRPGFLALMAALRPRPPFDILIMSEESRLGREALETGYALKRLLVAGVRVFLYLNDRELAISGATDKLTLSVAAFSDEQERERARQRTYDAMRHKAARGHVTGGVVFGYDNRPVATPDGRRRQHVERVVNETEAPVVRRIFELYVRGHGLRAIAHQLNAEDAPAPLPRRAGRPRGWAPSSVREILHRPLYRGQIVWNRTQKRDQWGVKRQSRRAVDDWITVEAPALRIVDDALWQAAHERLDGARQAYLRGTDGKLWGRPGNGAESKYLLTGFAVCGACGGSLFAHSRSHGRRRAYFYGCTSYHLRGPKVCGNRMALPMDDTDEAIRSGLEEDLLHPDAIAIGLREATRLLTEPGEDSGRRDALRSALADTEARLGRLKDAVLIGGDLRTLVDEMRAQERRRAQLAGELAAVQRPALAASDLEHVERELLAILEDWRGALRRHVMQARQMLRKLVIGRVTFTPRDGEVEAVMHCTLGRIFSTLLVPKAVVAPTGFEPVFQP